MPRRRSPAVAIKLKIESAAFIFYKREPEKIAENQTKASAVFWQRQMIQQTRL